SVPLYIALVDLYLKNKQTDDAVGVMQKLIVMEPDAAEHRLALAGIYWAEGKEQQAAEVMKAFLSAGPDKEQRWVQVANFYSSKNRPAEAEQQLKEGIRQNAKSFTIRFALSAFYLATNRPDQAVPFCRNASDWKGTLLIRRSSTQKILWQTSIWPASKSTKRNNMLMKLS